MDSPHFAGTASDIDPRRLVEDPAYRKRYARVLLDRTAESADHVELRRLARRVFPDLARFDAGASLAQLVGSAATLRAAERDGRVSSASADAGLINKPTHPLDYPPSYADLDADTRSVLIRFCEAELETGHVGREALENLDRRHGWPFSDRTFYVGPWKAARLRRRKDDD